MLLRLLVSNMSRIIRHTDRYGTDFTKLIAPKFFPSRTVSFCANPHSAGSVAAGTLVVPEISKLMSTATECILTDILPLEPFSVIRARHMIFSEKYRHPVPLVQ